MWQRSVVVWQRSERVHTLLLTLIRCRSHSSALIISDWNAISIFRWITLSSILWTRTQKSEKKNKDRENGYRVNWCWWLKINTETHRMNGSLHTDSYRNSLFSGKYWNLLHYRSLFSTLNHNQCFWHTNRQNIVIFPSCKCFAKNFHCSKIIVIKCESCFLLLFTIFDISMKKKSFSFNECSFLAREWVQEMHFSVNHLQLNCIVVESMWTSIKRSNDNSDEQFCVVDYTFCLSRRNKI